MYSSRGAIIYCPCRGSVELFTSGPAEVPGAAVRDIRTAVVDCSRFHRFTRLEALGRAVQPDPKDSELIYELRETGPVQCVERHGVRMSFEKLDQSNGATRCSYELRETGSFQWSYTVFIRKLG